MLTALLVSLVLRVSGHGQMVFPTSNRHQGSYADGGSCENQFSCVWFSQPAEIPGEPTLSEERYRTYNVKVQSGPRDWSRKFPWRAPGSAPVLGHGCGVAGGGPMRSESTAGIAPPGFDQGYDGILLPAQEPAVWTRGSVQEVAFGMLANHGGGYSYRLCPNDGNVTEECFQRNVLPFAKGTQLLRFADVYQPFGKAEQIADYEIPLVKWVDPATQAEWARNPMPGCALCDPGAKCMQGDLNFDDMNYCSQSCSGMNLTHCPPGLVQFPEPLNGISGFDMLGATGWAGFPFSIVDFVSVPHTLAPGSYLLSWRWDCEQSPQVWQNCADIAIR